jgi:hypothetical protein
MNKKLGQFFTPYWVAEHLVNQYFSFSADDVVIEPTCGKGAFLAAVPDHVEAVGVEVDPVLADEARAETGRLVLCGDILMVPLDVHPTIAVGNPPFNTEIFQGILDRLARIMPAGSRAGFILPAYFFQYATRARRYAERWAIRTDHLPRSIFPGLTLPLVFGQFELAERGRLIGFTLYDEMASLQLMGAAYRELLHSAKRSPWKKVFIHAMARLGGEASLDDLYREIAPRRPTGNIWWKEKVRQVAQELCRRVDRGRYVLENFGQQQLFSEIGG